MTAFSYAVEYEKIDCRTTIASVKAFFHSIARDTWVAQQHNRVAVTKKQLSFYNPALSDEEFNEFIKIQERRA